MFQNIFNPWRPCILANQHILHIVKNIRNIGIGLISVMKRVTLHNLKHDLNYDAKNMMHVFRLLKMCLEIAEENTLSIWRLDRNELLEIRNGKFSYGELIKKTHEILEQIDFAYEASNLPDKINVLEVDMLLVKVRNNFY